MSTAWLLLGLLVFAPPAQSSPYIWDQDDDHIDDRIETVHLLGYAFSFEQGDTQARQRIDVTRVPAGLAYGVYVIYDHPVTNADLLALTLRGLPVLHRIEAVPAVKSVASFLQVQLVAALPGVERVEASSVIHLLLHDNAAAIAPGMPEACLPDLVGYGRQRGAGVVVAILDTGINDAAEGRGLARIGGGAVPRWGDLPRVGLDTRFGGMAASIPLTWCSITGACHARRRSCSGSGGASGFARGSLWRSLRGREGSERRGGHRIAQSLDWCLHNAQRSWGVPGTGIDVINLSPVEPG
jgi:hypothetical protein